MDEEIKLKRYFIKDEELKSLKEDKLNSKDVAKNINLIIDNTKPPFAIAVTGISGIGKSSVINMVVENYENKLNSYSVQKINVWRDETSINKILEETCATHKENRATFENSNNTDIYNEINGKKEDIANSVDNNIGNNLYKNNETNNINNIINNTNNINNTINSTKNTTNNEDNNYNTNKKQNTVLNALAKTAKLILTSITCFIITTIIFILTEYLQNSRIYTSDIFFVENTYLNYRENFWLILIFTFGLTAVTYIINTLRLTIKKIQADSNKNSKESNNSTDNNYEDYNPDYSNYANNEYISNVEYVDEYGDFVEDIIPDNTIDTEKKHIIIIEDIDKLTVSKMLKALEEIKFCNSYENCILIVPFDEDVLNKAIEARNQLKMGANYRPLKFEKVLDKIFQFKIYIPYISNQDIKNYATNLVEETIPSFTEEYCDMLVLEKVIRSVLVYKNVTTPRHIKKLINNFINNKVLISYRVQNKNVDRSLVESKNFDLQLAKISVIQSDFEDFYDVLFRNFDYLEELTHLYCMEQQELKMVYEDIDEDLKPFLSNKYRALKNFLRQTKNCKVNNIATLMYLIKVKSEKMFKDRTISSYVLGDEDISELRIQDVLELVKVIDNEEDLKLFIDNNFEQLLENYENNVANKIYFNTFNEIINIMYNYINEQSYITYLEISANNYNLHPYESLEMFKHVHIEIPVYIMNILIIRIKESLSKENYDETFEFLRDNSDPFYEEDGNISEYVQFLVDYIALSSNPTDVIMELDENFTRIGKVYELNKNIKGLDNLDYDMAYSFMAKCLDNGDLSRMVNVINTILSDENSIDDCLNIEEKMSNYDLVDVVECDVDDISLLDNKELLTKYFKETTNLEDGENKEDKKEDNGDEKDVDDAIDETEDIQEPSKDSIENAKLLDGNYVLLKNIIGLCSVKQTEVSAVDVMKIIDKALQNKGDERYILEVYDILRGFDRICFYEIRRDFNEVIYSSFHNTRNNKIKKAALDCTRYFKNTRLFKTKLTKSEEKFYSEN